jgi:hypothetical protein
MLRQLPAAIATLLVIAGAGAAPPAPSLDWLAGHWCAERGDETVEEVWLPPHGGVAVGMSRTLSGDRTAAFEYLRIIDIDGLPAYVAQPGGRSPTTFRMTASGVQWVRFENPGHDFPQRIVYRREGDALHAEIAGPGTNGEQLVIPFDYRQCGRCGRCGPS